MLTAKRVAVRDTGGRAHVTHSSAHLPCKHTHTNQHHILTATQSPIQYCSQYGMGLIGQEVVPSLDRVGRLRQVAQAGQRHAAGVGTAHRKAAAHKTRVSFVPDTQGKMQLEMLEDKYGISGADPHRKQTACM